MDEPLLSPAGGARISAAAPGWTRMKKLHSHRSIYLLFGVCWFSYCTAYLGRLNFTACIAAMEETTLLTKVELGRDKSQ